MQTRIIPATENDLASILFFIRELARYEKLSDAVTATEADLKASLFGAKKYAEVVFLEENNERVGFAVYCHNYSTFLGKPGLYLEDLYILETHRGKGYGKLMLAYLAKIAVERGCGRFEWSVLDWNEPSIKFYLSLGATAMDEWTVYRLTGTALENLAAKA